MPTKTIYIFGPQDNYSILTCRLWLKFQFRASRLFGGNVCIYFIKLAYDFESFNHFPIFNKNLHSKKIEVSFWCLKAKTKFKLLINKPLNRKVRLPSAPLESVTKFTKKQ
jgi:hypothetical protein